jgi:CHAT domain-containing protein
MKQVYWFLIFLSIVRFVPASSLEKTEGILQQANLYADRYDWAKALPLYTEAELQLAHAGDLAGAAYAHIGCIRASVKTRFPQQIADALSNEIKRSPWKNDPSFRLRALFLKADVDTEIDAYSVGDFNTDQRRRNWQEILTLSSQLGNKHLEERAQGELAILKIFDKDVIGSDEIASVLWQAKSSGDLMNELRFRTAIATMYRSVGLDHDALGHFERATDLAERSQAFSFFPAYFGKAVTLLADHRLQEALPLIEHCAAQARITGSVVNDAQVLYLQGRAYYANSRSPEAVGLLKKSLDLASELGYQRLISMITLELSHIYQMNGELWKALDCAELGLQASAKTGDPFEAILHIHDKGTIRADQGRFAESDRLYAQAIQALNTLLAKFTSAYTRAFIVSRMSDLYSDYFSLSLLKLKDPAKAFAILEQARGRSVSDSLRGRMTDPIPTKESIQNSFEEYEKNLSRFQAQLWAKKDPVEFRKIMSEIFDLERSLGNSGEAGRHTIDARTFPSIPLVEIQKSLYPGEIILEYVLRESSSTCFVISREDAQGFALAPRRVIEEAVAGYRKEARKGLQGSKIGRKIYDLLLAPVKGFDQKLRITIVPDGLLHLLPFEAIPDPSGKLLIDSHMIDYSPSATVTFLLRKSPAPWTGRNRFLGVGDARYHGTDESGIVYFANQPRPARLPGSRAEVLSIAKALKDVSETATLIGEDVNEPALKKFHLEDFDILHFAVHGTSDVNYPARSGLLLGPSSDEAEDGIFQAWEISKLRLQTDLVVLSACDTAFGRVLDQEGVSNLVQSFLLAGARSVVASLWPVDDRSTADLMARFYSYLAQGMDKGSALRQAKLDFIAKYKDKALPIFWAGMIMIGDSSNSVLGEHREKDAEGSIH